jgi:hypothetical protein
VTDKADTSVPTYKNIDTAPVIYFDIVPTYGVMNGAVQIELAARTLTPDGDSVAVEFVCVARLRCSPTAAGYLRNAIDKAMEPLNQSQDAPTAAATRLN